VTVSAWIKRSTPRLNFVEAEIAQDGQTKVTASGKFVRQPSPATEDCRARD